MKKKETLDCRKCGICCVAPHGGIEFVDIEPKDFDRLSKYYQKKIDQQGAFGYLGFVPMCLPLKITETETRCDALRGTVMKKVSCTIYNRRPSACAAFKPGSRYCLELRKLHNEEM